MASNLYVHFPFCRHKCRYCSLFSRTDVTAEGRAAYVQLLVAALAELPTVATAPLGTIYFGGGTPALCDLAPFLRALAPWCSPATEFTVELHPLDVTDALLETLREGGVNRLSIGIQSLDDDILAHMERGYRFADAEAAFARARNSFDNVGIDLIVGYPGETSALTPRHARLARWGLRHCSVYALQNERGLAGAASDEAAMDRLAIMCAFLGELGLERYEISNYAAPGYACRHNLAVWEGADYVGLGAGAAGRLGRQRTRNWGLGEAGWRGVRTTSETVSSETDETERAIFRLRTRAGLDCANRADWRRALERFVNEGLVCRAGDRFCLTARGTEVCDTILAELV